MDLHRVLKVTVTGRKVLIDFRDCCLEVTVRHAFMLRGHEVKAAGDLKTGDLIWVDVQMFLAAERLKRRSVALSENYGPIRAH